jgi:hypothetical protein
LLDTGVINGRCKTGHRGRVVAICLESDVYRFQVDFTEAAKAKDAET